MENRLVMIIHDVRSALNVGGILRTADGLGITRVYMSGYTPYPSEKNDGRLPHVRARAEKQIHKTALGAEHTVAWEHVDNLQDLLARLRNQKYLIAALEQHKTALNLTDFKTVRDVALLVGNEVNGLESDVLKSTDVILEIPMLGKKESYNVASAAAMVLYHLRYVA